MFCFYVAVEMVDLSFVLFIRARGGECVSLDLAAGPQFDLADDVVWASSFTASRPRPRSLALADM